MAAGLWDKIAQEALGQLKQDGFDIGHLSPQDPTFDHETWADSIVAIPLVVNQPSRTHFHCKSSRRKYLPLIPALRDFVRQCDDPFCERFLICTRDAEIPQEELRDLAKSAANFIENFPPQ